MTHASPPPPASSRIEAFLVGIALAHLQCTLGFVAMRGIGASATAWFAILFCWLLGGLGGVMSVQSQRLSTHRESILVYGTLLLLLAAEWTAQLTPYSLFPRLTVMSAAIAGGAYGGAFLSSRGSHTRSIAALFFHENNGFLTGFLTASLTLLLSASLLLPVTILVVLLSRSVRWHATSRPVLISLILGISSTSFQILFQAGSDPAWDGLKTASVLAHPEAVGLREWLFFAHPLVIPLTVPFQLLTSDPLQAVLLREAVCHGLLISLLFLAGRAICAQHKQKLIVATLACLQVFLAVGRWQLAIAGEEKEAMLLFGSLFLVFYLDHRGLWNLKISSFQKLSHWARRALLGLLLLLAVAMHLVNGLLIVWLLVDLLLATERRQVAREVISILLFSATLAVPFFLWLAIGPGGGRTPEQIARFYFEYHVSGEFFSIPTTLSERLFDSYRGLRTWLFGELPFQHPIAESVVAAGLLLGLCLSALRQAPQVVLRLLMWIVLVFLHFLFFQPWNPEAWAPAALCGSLVVALGLLGMGRGLLARKLFAVCWICVLGLLLGSNQKAGHFSSERVREFVSAEQVSATPLRDLVRWLDINLERDAEILVSDRLLLSYFQLYTARVPVIVQYLGVSPQELRTKHHLTTLSLHFYTPARTPAEINDAIRSGRPVYLIGNEAASTAMVNLPWGGLILSRMLSPLPDALPSPLAGSRPEPLPVAVPPSNVDAEIHDLLANDLTLTAVTTINPTVFKLSFHRDGRDFAAKWKPLGIEASELQEGFDGNNAPRCEVAARQVDRWLSADDQRRQLVPEVVIRALHRNIPCDRACQYVPKIMGSEVPATFPMINDHLVLGALSAWMENAERPTTFHGGLWNPPRYSSDPDYRRSLSDLMTFLFLIAHGDANYPDNFLQTKSPPFRVFSIDNGRSLDGIPFYTKEGDPDWEPMAKLTPQTLVVPTLSQQTMTRLGLLGRSSLAKDLLLVSAVDLRSGQAVAEPRTEPQLAPFVGKPLSEIPALRRLSRQSYLTPETSDGGPWLVQGLSAQGIRDLLARAESLLAHQKQAGVPLFDF